MYKIGFTEIINRNLCRRGGPHHLVSPAAAVPEIFIHVFVTLLGNQSKLSGPSDRVIPGVNHMITLVVKGLSVFFVKTRQNPFHISYALLWHNTDFKLCGRFQGNRKILIIITQEVPVLFFHVISLAHLFLHNGVKNPVGYRLSPVI